METTKNTTENTNSLTFNTLALESINGHFTFEPNETIEIHVSLSNTEIRVEHFRSSNHMIDPIKVENYHCLYGMMGYQSTEEKFNEIINSIS